MLVSIGERNDDARAEAELWMEGMSELAIIQLARSQAEQALFLSSSPKASTQEAYHACVTAMALVEGFLEKANLEEQGDGYLFQEYANFLKVSVL
jgi:hypothetical protein